MRRHNEIEAVVDIAPHRSARAQLYTADTQAGKASRSESNFVAIGQSKRIDFYLSLYINGLTFVSNK
jgi:hypothetical protein